MSKVNARVIQKPGEEIPTEIIASSIVYVANSMSLIRGGRLNDRALVTLIQDACPVRIGRDKIEMVLNAIRDLKKTYIRENDPNALRRA